MIVDWMPHILGWWFHLCVHTWKNKDGQRVTLFIVNDDISRSYLFGL